MNRTDVVERFVHQKSLRKSQQTRSSRRVQKFDAFNEKSKILSCNHRTSTLIASQLNQSIQSTTMQNNNSDLLGGYGQRPSLSDVLASLSQRQSAHDRLLTEASLLGSVGGGGGGASHADLIAALTSRSSGFSEFAASRGLASHELDGYGGGGSGSDPLLFASAIAHQRQMELAKAARRDALMNEAYKRGREEALLSLVRLQGMEGLGGQPLSAQSSSAAGALSLLESAARLSSSDPSYASSATNNNSAERRIKKNSPYVDASSLKDPDPVILANRRARGGVTEPFPEKLHRMLREVDEAGCNDCVSFFAHGRAFAVHNPTRFVTEIMPKYFRQSRLSSFQRQLNLYGFTRITQGPDAGGYYHELFLKGRPNLCVHMRRVGVPQGPGKGNNKAPSNEVRYSLIDSLCCCD
jgi:hypothetical protein